MKIEIDNEGASYRAKITIDGKTIEFGQKFDGSIRTESGITAAEFSETLGGLILQAFAPVIITALQAEAYAAEAQGIVDPRCFTWERLNRGAYLAAKERLT